MERAGIEEILKKELSFDEESPRMVRAITVWLSEDYKKKYEELQAMTNKRFCVAVRAIVTQSIDVALQIVEEKK